MALSSFICHALVAGAELSTSTFVRVGISPVLAPFYKMMVE